MNSSSNPHVALTKKLWRKQILTHLDDVSLTKFSLVCRGARDLAEKPLLASKLVNEMRAERMADAHEPRQKKQANDGHRRRPYSLSQLIKILTYMPFSYRPLIPYLLTLSLFKDHAEVTIKTVYTSLMQNVSPKHFEDTTTSCINSALTLLSLLGGLEKSKNIQIMMGKRYRHQLRLPLPSQKIWTYTECNMFKGVILSEMMRHHPDFITTGISDDDYYRHAKSKVSCLNEEVNRHANDIRKNVSDDEAFIQQMKIALSRQEFNSQTVINLREHLFANVTSVSAGCSFIYYISSIIPDDKCHHTFLLEQFYSEDAGSVRYRLYQSWIKTSTLYDSLMKQYHQSGQHEWNETDVYRFLTKLELFYSTSQPGKLSEFDCFGYGKRHLQRSVMAAFDQDELTCTRLEYYVLPINPSDCLSHLDRLANDNEALRACFK